MRSACTGHDALIKPLSMCTVHCCQGVLARHRLTCGTPRASRDVLKKAPGVDDTGYQGTGPQRFQRGVPSATFDLGGPHSRIPADENFTVAGEADESDRWRASSRCSCSTGRLLSSQAFKAAL